MSFSQENTSKKLISVPVLLSSFIGMIVAASLAFGMQASMSASALQQSNSTEDFAKFAYAFNQGYEARATSASSSDGQVSCSSVTAPTSDQAGATQTNTAVAPVGGKGAGVAVVKASARTAAMINSFNSYTSMVNNSSSVTSINSNNTVGSNNTNKTDVSIKHSKGVVVGISNEQTGTQMNAEDSFNKDSYNTKNETSIVNDSFNKDVDVTNTTTTTTDVDVNKEVNVTNTQETTNTDNSNSNNNSNNTTTDNSNSGNFSGNDTEIDVEAAIAVDSYNED